MECPDHGKRTRMRIESGEPLRCRDCGETLVEVRYVRVATAISPVAFCGYCNRAGDACTCEKEPPMVPCDDAALERAAKSIAPHVGFGYAREIVERAFRAAADAP